jgi:uncharacterized caspase-like protein
MSDRALVIGLDAYDNPAWELRAAVRDAVAFAKWVTAPGAGRATEETLTLLLSPHPARPVTDVKFQLATDDAIWHALQDHKKNGADAQRLWFFYAGHGLAPGGGGPDEAPVLVPADVKDLDRYLSRPIDLGSWIRDMQIRKPEYQVYFVDACRGIVVSEDAVTATKSLFFDLSKVQAGDQARQAVLFATTAGQLANEQGLHGLFGGALIDGLQGAGPALEPDAGTEEFVLTFGALAAYTKRRIQLRSEEARRANTTLPTQEPAESLFRAQSALELARFKDKPSAPVKVFVEPEEATTVGTAGIRGYNEWKRVWERQAEKPSPLGVPVVWELSSSVHQIEIEARGFENWKKKVEVIGPMELHADLVPKPSVPGAAVRDGLESLRSPKRADTLPAPPDGAELAAGKQGRLVVRAYDRYARIEVFDAGGKRVEAAWTGLDTTLPVGSYRIEIALPTERPVVQSVLVTADEPVVIDVQPDPQLTQRLPPTAGMIQPHDGRSMPSEAFGIVTTTHLGSLLAWAAAAAQYDPGGDGQKLRALGVERLPPAPDACFVRVLVGDARAPDSNPQGGPIETLLLDMNQQMAVLTPLPALAGFAMQWHAPVHFPTSLTLQTGGLNPRRIPLPFIAGHVWTIVIVRESSQHTEIHRYLQPLAPPTPFDDTIRLVEQSWRALEARTPLYDDEAGRLLARNLDPLSLAVIGYRLALESRWQEVATVVDRLGTIELADRHVLAALVGQRDQNMELALHSPSVPVVGEGYRLMEAWLIDHFAKQNMPPPAAPEPFTGGVWTTFDTRGQAVVSKAFPVRNAPAWAEPLLAAAAATAKIEPGPGWPSPFIGTGFLIGPRALALTDFIVDAKPTVADFGDERVVIEEVVGATNDDRHGALARIAPVSRVPLKIRWALPEVGMRIAVIGHPLITFTPTIITLAAFTTYPTGEKMIMPGVIVAVEPTRLVYECWTMAGVGGGPIIDLATGEVIGIHHSGKYEGGAKKLGFGVPVTAIEALLKTPI